MDPLFSIIIPCYNLGKYLPECLESVLNQEYKKFEVIVVDDGSKDTFTIEYLNSIKDEKIKVFFQANQGVSVARNFGASVAKGDYFLFVDADDKVDPQYLLLAKKELERDPSLDYIYCDLVEFEGGTEYRPLGDLQMSKVLLHAVTHVSAIISRSLWIRTGGFDKEFLQGREDWDLLIRIISMGVNYYKIPLPLLQYRIRQDSRDKVANEKHDEELEQLIFLKNISSYLQEYSKPISALRLIEEQRKINEDLKGHITNIYNTRSYKLGSLLLSPFKLASKLISKK